MGNFATSFGRRTGGVEVIDYSSNNAYKYPPKAGNYFGTHFIMGGERFDMSQPESYLFGENTDLNFLGCKPIPFPYPPGTGNEPTRTLKSLVNIRKDSLKLVRIPEAVKLKPDDNQEDTSTGKYNLEFIFDSDVKCMVKIFYFATEEISNGHLSYHSRTPQLTSETFTYERGANQTFQQSSHVIEPAAFQDAEWQYSPDKEEIPVVIQCSAEDDDNTPHAHLTYAVVERSSVDGCYIIKPLKQKQFVHGLCYLLQEIYGIENKNTEKSKDEEDPDDEVEDSGAECVICMSDMRDTLILPCRHLCLCSTCAESLRFQASSCPICRSPFRALLQIRAMRRKQAVAVQQFGDQMTEDNPVSQEGVPTGYKAVSLIEALNGPCGLPPPNTMEGIHVPPPSRIVTLDTESHNKRRTGKKHSVPVETVKEMVMSTEDKKVVEEKESETTDETLSKTGTPAPEPAKSPAQKTKSRSNRHRSKGDNRPLQRSPSSDQEPPRGDSMEVVNEVKKGMRRSNSPEADKPGLTVEYPPLTVSSENLADDEREDTSDGEIEPEPDYDDDSYSAIVDDSKSERRTDADTDDERSAPPSYNTLDEDRLVPPSYHAVMSETESGAQDTEPDTDDCFSSHLKLQLSTSPPNSTNSSASSSDAMLPPGHRD